MATERTQPLPVRAGSVIVFSRHLMHGAMPNLGDGVRLSLDLRYQRVDQPSGRSYLPGFHRPQSLESVIRAARPPRVAAALAEGNGAARGRSTGQHRPPLGYQPPALRVTSPFVVSASTSSRQALSNHALSAG